MNKAKILLFISALGMVGCVIGITQYGDLPYASLCSVATGVLSIVTFGISIFAIGRLSLEETRQMESAQYAIDRLLKRK